MNKLLLIFGALFLLRVSIINDQQFVGVNGVNLLEKQTLINKSVELLCSLKPNTNHFDFNYKNINRQKFGQNFWNNVQRGHQISFNHNGNIRLYYQSKRYNYHQMNKREQENSVMWITWFKNSNSPKPFLTINANEKFFGNNAAILEHNQPLLLPSIIIASNDDNENKLNKEPGSIPDLQKIVDIDGNTELIINGLRESFYNRAFYRVDFANEKAFLTINDVQVEDEGTYRCQVDFQNSRSINTLINLIAIGIYFIE